MNQTLEITLVFPAFIGNSVIKGMLFFGVIGFIVGAISAGLINPTAVLKTAVITALISSLIAPFGIWQSKHREKRETTEIKPMLSVKAVRSDDTAVIW